mgnify:CR=1 FL=1
MHVRVEHNKKKEGLMNKETISLAASVVIMAILFALSIVSQRTQINLYENHHSIYLD